MLIGLVTAALSGCISAQLAGRPGLPVGLALASYLVAVPFVWTASISAAATWPEAAVSFAVSALMQAVVFVAATLPLLARQD